jgi:preprotein translocase subunit SecF
MEFFRLKKDIPFMSYARTTTVISAVTFVLAVFFLFTRGLNLSVEFTGGTSIRARCRAPWPRPVTPTAKCRISALRPI